MGVQVLPPYLKPGRGFLAEALRLASPGTSPVARFGNTKRSSATAAFSATSDAAPAEPTRLSQQLNSAAAAAVVESLKGVSDQETESAQRLEPAAAAVGGSDEQLPDQATAAAQGSESAGKEGAGVDTSHDSAAKGGEEIGIEGPADAEAPADIMQGQRPDLEQPDELDREPGTEQLEREPRPGEERPMSPEAYSREGQTLEGLELDRGSEPAALAATRSGSMPASVTGSGALPASIMDYANQLPEEGSEGPAAKADQGSGVRDMKVGI